MVDRLVSGTAAWAGAANRYAGRVPVWGEAGLIGVATTAATYNFTLR